MAGTLVAPWVLHRSWAIVLLCFAFLKGSDIGYSHALVSSRQTWNGAAYPCISGSKRCHPSLTHRSWGQISLSPSALNSVLDRLDSLRIKLTSKQSPNVESYEGEAVPFVIQRIGRGTKSEIKEISHMCIDVFFNKQKSVDDRLKGLPPWKAIQLAYLRSFQYGDIMSRNALNQSQQVDLLVARRVYLAMNASKLSGFESSSIDDESQIFHRENILGSDGNADGFVTGEIIGYCEVSEKKFGLGGVYENGVSLVESGKNERRPYLANLSVVDSARKSGVGSRLLDACEKAVLDWNAGYEEIVLQVEEDNETAIQFYKKRGWEFVFADPTCRRYDTSGLFLKESRITKYAMIKSLSSRQENVSDRNEDGTDTNFQSFFMRARLDSDAAL